MKALWLRFRSADYNGQTSCVVGLSSHQHKLCIAHEGQFAEVESDFDFLIIIIIISLSGCTTGLVFTIVASRSQRRGYIGHDRDWM